MVDILLCTSISFVKRWETLALVCIPKDFRISIDTRINHKFVMHRIKKQNEVLLKSRKGTVQPDAFKDFFHAVCIFLLIITPYPPASS